MVNTYDVAIVGGGPAGSWLARELAQQQHSVILFERSPVAGEPNFSSAGTPAATTNIFRLPRNAIACTCSRLSVVGLHANTSWVLPDSSYHVYDFRLLKQSLLHQAEQAGATVMLGTEVRGIVHIDSPQIELSNNTTCNARIIIDASGPTSIIGRQIGLQNRTTYTPAIGMEMVAEVDPYILPKQSQNSLTFFLGSLWAPHGYGWIFPMGDNLFKLGICTYIPNKIILREAFDSFVQRLLSNKPHRVLETHGGALFVGGGIRKHTYKNILIIGDAADQTNPLGGEGIRHVLHSAQIASRCISNALTTNNMGKLQRYDRRWKSYVGQRWNISARIAKKSYTTFTDETWDRVIRLCSRFSPQEAHDVLFEYRVKPIIRSIVQAKLFGNKSELQSTP